MKIVLETKRLYCREMNDDDFVALSKIITPNNPEYVQKWLDWCKSSYQKYGFGHMAVIDKDTNEMIGSAGISMQYIDDEWKEEIGYHLREDHRHKGFGKEIAIAFRDYFFTHFNKNEVYSYMHEDNIPSYKTAEAMGMSFLHLFKDRSGDIYRVYRITRDEWIICQKQNN